MEGWFEQLKDDVRIVQVYMYVYILDTCIIMNIIKHFGWMDGWVDGCMGRWMDG